MGLGTDASEVSNISITTLQLGIEEQANNKLLCSPRRVVWILSDSVARECNDVAQAQMSRHVTSSMCTSRTTQISKPVLVWVPLHGGKRCSSLCIEDIMASVWKAPGKHAPHPSIVESDGNPAIMAEAVINYSEFILRLDVLSRKNTISGADLFSNILSYETQREHRAARNRRRRETRNICAGIGEFARSSIEYPRRSRACRSRRCASWTSLIFPRTMRDAVRGGGSTAEKKKKRIESQVTRLMS